MVNFNQLSAALLTVGLSAVSHAHPEEHEMAEALMKRDEHAVIVQRGLEDCVNHPKFIELQRRGQERRWNKAQQLRKARGIQESTPYKTKRDLSALEAFEEVNHNMTSLGYTESTDASTLFASYKNASCILTPEVTYGPYFVTGEYYRTDVVEDQEGVPVHIEYQYIDISTCDVATGLYLETWQANATGVYSGIVASGNGNDADSENLDTTFLRGVTKVNDEGVAYFDTIFAGHYEGRATHIHLIAQQNGTVWDNGTYSGGTISHVGQLFFDEDLKDAVYATAPYNTNTQSYTTNDADMWAPDQADNNYDPIPDYAYLGEDITDGLLMWISIGINMTAEYTVEAAATLTADGGVSSDSSIGSSSGSNSGSAPSGSGSAPSGSMSMGSAQSGSAGSVPSGMSMGAGQSMGSGSAPSGMSMGAQSSSATIASSSVASSSSSSASAVAISSASSKASSSSASSKSSSSTAKVSSSVASSKIASSAVSVKLSTSTVAKAKTSAVSSSSSVAAAAINKSSSSKSSSSIKASSKSTSTLKTSSKSTSTKSSSKSSSTPAKKSSSTKAAQKPSSTKKTTSTKKSSSSVKKPAATNPVKKSTSTKKTSAHKSTSTKKTVKTSSTTKKGMQTVTTKTTSKKH